MSGTGAWSPRRLTRLDLSHDATTTDRRLSHPLDRINDQLVPLGRGFAKHEDRAVCGRRPRVHEQEDSDRCYEDGTSVSHISPALFDQDRLRSVYRHDDGLVAPPGFVDQANAVPSDREDKVHDRRRARAPSVDPDVGVRVRMNRQPPARLRLGGDRFRRRWSDRFWLRWHRNARASSGDLRAREQVPDE